MDVGHTRRAVVVTASAATAVEPKNILMMGGTRFIGLFLARELVKAGHQVCIHIDSYGDFLLFKKINLVLDQHMQSSSPILVIIKIV